MQREVSAQKLVEQFVKMCGRRRRPGGEFVMIYADRSARAQSLATIMIISLFEQDSSATYINGT
jgi:hypothetical protein